MIDLISQIFNLFLIDPLTNLFVALSIFTGNAGIGVIILTVLIRVATFPFYQRQMHTSRMMAAMGPRMSELQKKYKDPKRRSEEQMKLYKEAGINPLGCVSGMLLQFPILIALYRTFSFAVGETPEALIKVSARLYPWSYLRQGMPLADDFLWFHLGRPDPLLLPILVAATTYALQKMTVLPTTDERQKAQNSMMNLMMPLLFGWITLTLPSGLGLYYVLSNLIGMVMQYMYVGRGPFNWQALLGLSQEPVLPRALEVRQAQTNLASSIGRDEDEEPVPESAAKTNGTTAADARRRRRYANGRRRNRR
jgi:YidC/Oxa1 family membrane protein insertase